MEIVEGYVVCDEDGCKVTSTQSFVRRAVMIDRPPFIADLCECCFLQLSTALQTRYAGQARYAVKVPRAVLRYLVREEVGEWPRQRKVKFFGDSPPTAVGEDNDRSDFADLRIPSPKAAKKPTKPKPSSRAAKVSVDQVEKETDNGGELVLSGDW